MESIKNISSHNQSNRQNFYNADEETSSSEDNSKQTFDLAQLLKTGHQKRKFSNSQTHTNIKLLV